MIALALAATLTWQNPAGDSLFSHHEHVRLFATCTACHSGVVTGRDAEVLPAPEQCAACHDGRAERRVNWRPRPLEPSNLRFTHASHEREVRQRGDSALTCVACHTQGGATAFMAAGRAEPERCLSCHAHQAPSHLAAARCGSCHVPVREARALSIARLARLPAPPSHEAASFTVTHGDESRAGQASCQYCHTSESCARCHANAARLSEIAVLGSDARMAGIISLRPIHYPLPASHRRTDFPRTHGGEAVAAGAACANCHTRQSCLGCHGSDRRADAIAQLPARTSDGAPGVELGDRRPPDHGPAFRLEHRAAANSGAIQCSSCHTQRFCTACHAESPGAGFHVANYVQRHASAAYSADLQCASCHQVTAFCSSCHREVGLQARGGVTAGSFHNGVANWTFAHGGVARRAMETCASCHAQAFCTQCHSATRGWRVSPHGSRPPDGPRNAPMCRFCHQ